MYKKLFSSQKYSRRGNLGKAILCVSVSIGLSFSLLSEAVRLIDKDRLAVHQTQRNPSWNCIEATCVVEQSKEKKNYKGNWQISLCKNVIWHLWLQWWRPIRELCCIDSGRAWWFIQPTRDWCEASHHYFDSWSLCIRPVSDWEVWMCVGLVQQWTVAVFLCVPIGTLLIVCLCLHPIC